uniref:Uncharacterized protein n=1 Tax=Lepeophtheirus salmonis TaxID=72036 RepID=A0A0K2VGQ7_LEPSM
MVATTTAATSSSSESSPITSSVSASVASTPGSTTTSSMGNLHFQFLSIDRCTIQFARGIICVLGVRHRHKGVALLCDIDIRYGTDFAEFIFQYAPRTSVSNAMDK